MVTTADGLASKRAATKEMILARVLPLVEVFAERAQAAEAARRVPDVSIKELVDAGITRILVPPSWGGYGLEFDTWFDVVREISKGDASHGWCASLMIHHPHYVSLCNEEAQKAVWADGPDVVIAASLIPNAQIKPVEGGYLVSSTAPFTSGINHSSWVFVGGFVTEMAQPEWTFLLIPPGKFNVVDSWFTTGMCATGSNTVVVNDVFVPKEHAIRLSDLREGRAPGAMLYPGAIYRAPFIAFAPITFVTPMLGAAQGAYEHFREWTKARTGAGGVSIAEITSIQVRLARTAADLDAAELLLRRAVATAQSGAPLTLELRARSMRDFSRAAELVLGAVDTLMAMSGTAGFGISNPIQRAWRDINFAAKHVSLNSESNFSYFGRMELDIARDSQQPFY